MCLGLPGALGSSWQRPTLEGWHRGCWYDSWPQHSAWTQLHHTPQITHLSSKFNLLSVQQYAHPVRVTDLAGMSHGPLHPPFCSPSSPFFHLEAGLGLQGWRKRTRGRWQEHIGHDPGWSGVYLTSGLSSGSQGLGADAART